MGSRGSLRWLTAGRLAKGGLALAVIAIVLAVVLPLWVSAPRSPGSEASQAVPTATATATPTLPETPSPTPTAAPSATDSPSPEPTPTPTAAPTPTPVARVRTPAPVAAGTQCPSCDFGVAQADFYVIPGGTLYLTATPFGSAKISSCTIKVVLPGGAILTGSRSGAQGNGVVGFSWVVPSGTPPGVITGSATCKFGPTTLTRPLPNVQIAES